jgi:hypothetical protein
MNPREAWDRIGINPGRVAVLLIGFAIALFVSSIARYFGAYDLLGFTCDAREKATLMQFPQYGGKVIGEDIKGLSVARR